MFFVAAVVSTPSKVADDSGGFSSSRNRKCNQGGPGMRQTHGNVECYPVGYPSRSGGKQCIPEGEECSKSGGYNSTGDSDASRSAQRPSTTSYGTGGYGTSVAARCQGAHSCPGNVAGECCHHGHSCNSGTSFFTGNRI